MADTDQADLTTLTVELLSAFVSNNSVDSEALPALIQSTHTALAGINAPPAPEPETPEFTPAVSVRKSLASPDFLISLIDGKPYKMLKRHLATNGLTPAEYRSRYNLPKDYPMVSKNYSEARRAVAEKLGLGRNVVRAKDKGDAPVAAEAAPETPFVTATKTSKAHKTAPKSVAVAAKTKPPVRSKTKASDPVTTPAAEPAPADAAVATEPAAKKARALARAAAASETVTAPAAKSKATAKVKAPAKAKVVVPMSESLTANTQATKSAAKAKARKTRVPAE